MSSVEPTEEGTTQPKRNKWLGPVAGGKFDPAVQRYLNSVPAAQVRTLSAQLQKAADLMCKKGKSNLQIPLYYHPSLLFLFDILGLHVMLDGHSVWWVTF